MSSFSVTTTCEVPEWRVRDLLCCALEGGSGYWAQIESYKGPTRAELAELEFPLLEVPFRPGWRVAIRTIEEESEVLYLDRDAIARGLQLFQENYPRRWAEFMAETEDAITGDVFLQCCLLGEVVYG